MSHFSSIELQIKNGEILQEVLQELGHSVAVDAKVRGYRGDSTYAEYVIRQDNGYDIGFRRQGENYEIIADFWGAKINEKQFVNNISQKYAHKTLMTAVEEQGFNIEEQETLEDGTVRVVVGRWV